MNLKPCICIGGFTDERLAAARNAGFSYAEVNFGELALMGDDKRREYLDKLASIGLTPVAANCFVPWTFKPQNGFFTGAFDRPAFAAYIAEAFEKTKDMHFESIAFGSGAFRTIPQGYDADKAADLFCEVISEDIVPMLEKYDAVLSIEELNEKETNFLNTCLQAAKIASRIAHPRVGVLCDYFHMALGGETASDVPRFAASVTHLHIASPSRYRAMPMANDGDNEGYAAVLAALDACGYAGKYLSVEGGVPEGMDENDAFKACYGYLAGLLGE